METGNIDNYRQRTCSETRAICIFFNLKLTDLTLVLLNQDIPCLCKQCRAKSVGFWRQLIWICTVCHSVCEFISTIWIKESDWLTTISGCGILIYSAWQGLTVTICETLYFLLIFGDQFGLHFLPRHFCRNIWLERDRPHNLLITTPTRILLNHKGRQSNVWLSWQTSKKKKKT